jgi:hypothetical protein
VTGRQEVADGGALFGTQTGHEVFDRRLQAAPVPVRMPSTRW